MPGADLTVEPFRWDQRLFTILLKPPASCDGNNGLNNTVTEGGDSLIGPMSEVTGGKCLTVQSMNALLLAISNLLPRLVPAVVVDFERINTGTPLPTQGSSSSLGAAGAAQPSAASISTPEAQLSIPASCLHKMLFVRSNTGHWPIPEAFLPDTSMPTLVSILPPTSPPPQPPKQKSPQHPGHSHQLRPLPSLPAPRIR